MSWRNAWGILKQTFLDGIDDNIPQLGAALAYYSIFSIAPLVLLAIALAGLVFGAQAGRGAVSQEIKETVGVQVSQAIESILQSASTSRTGVLATILSVIVLFFGASGAFIQLQDSLNTIWKVMPRPGRGFWGILHDRFLSYAMVLGTGILIVVSLIATSALMVVVTYFSASFSATTLDLWTALNWVVSFVVIALLFALIYKYLPDVKLRWSDVWAGAVVTALLFTLGKYLIGLYLGRSSVTSAYGAAGSLVVILLWVYYSAQILLFGAEFTRVYTLRRRSRVEPSDNAILRSNPFPLSPR